MMKTQRSLTFESRHRTKETRRFPIEAAINYFSFGGKDYNCAFVRDISGRKQAERDVSKSEGRYCLLVEDNSDVLYRVDEVARISYMSRAVRQPSGYTADELIGKSFIEFLHPDDLVSVMQSFQHTLRGDAEPRECRTITKSGEVRWISASVMPLVKKGQVRYAGSDHRHYGS